MQEVFLATFSWLVRLLPVFDCFKGWTTWLLGGRVEWPSKKSEHFHMLLRMLEIAFPSTKLSKFSGETYPGPPPPYLDTPAFAARRLFESPFSISYLHQSGGYHLNHRFHVKKKIVNGPWLRDILEFYLEKSQLVFNTFFSFFFRTVHFSVNFCTLSTYDMQLNNLQPFSNFVNGLNIYLLSHAQEIHLKLPNKIWIAARRNKE